jgi:hypothetical protein
MSKWFRRRRHHGPRPTSVRHIEIDGVKVPVYTYPADDPVLAKLMPKVIDVGPYEPDQGHPLN